MTPVKLEFKVEKTSRKFVEDLDSWIEMIIFDLLLTTFEGQVILIIWGCWDYFDNFLSEQQFLEYLAFKE